MRIAEIAPLIYPVPPKKYGGAELIISLITEGLVKRGHDVTLFANRESETKAKLVSGQNKELSIDRPSQVSNVRNLFNMCLATESDKKFDLLHWHVSSDITPLMISSLSHEIPNVITFHNHFGDRKNLEDVYNFYLHRDNRFLISISDSHRKQFPFKFHQTIYNGIDVDQIRFDQGSDRKYLVWMGRFDTTKGPDIAIKVALELGLPLKLAAREPNESDLYFQNDIKPYLGKNGIEYIGAVGPEEKNDLLAGAIAFLNPIRWEEPFGLVMVEAMAAGVPVVSFNHGSVPEIIESGSTGFITKMDSESSMVESVRHLLEMKAEDIKTMQLAGRNLVNDKFSSEKMVEEYEKTFKEIVSSKQV